MINRVLIRIKVIQILYSYILVEKKFTLESLPTPPTKEKRFAYGLYVDMLVLLVKLARAVDGNKRAHLLVDTRFISRIAADETIKAALAKYGDLDPFASVVGPLAGIISESALYKRFQDDSKKNEAQVDEELWKNIFNLIVMQYAPLRELAEKREFYTLRGFERMRDMMNQTFVNFLTSQEDIREVEEALAESLGKARELYLQLMQLPVELTDLREKILDVNRYKFLRTAEDINPNLRFVENKLVEKLRANAELSTWAENADKELWRSEDPELISQLLNAVLESEIYANYMELEHTDLEADCELWRSLYKNVLLDNPNFLQFMEDKSVLWNDDLGIISEFVLKTFKRVDEAGRVELLDKFKDEEDSKFGYELLKYVYKNRDLYRPYIEEALKNGKWEAERVAFMDMVIIQTAIAEIMNFPSIPLRVSINEYVEIAKSYSSARSGSFVNGVLASVIAKLQEDGKLLKSY